MMVSRPEPNDDPPLDELSPGLRKAVDAVLRDGPPEELTRRCLDAARRRRPAKAGRPARRAVYLVAFAAAACVAAALLVWQFRGGGPGREPIARPPSAPQKVPSPEQPVDTPQPSPTWWAYHQAARQSPEALEALLDEHADQLALSGPTSWRFGVPVDSQTETL